MGPAEAWSFSNGAEFPGATGGLTFDARARPGGGVSPWPSLVGKLPVTTELPEQLQPDSRKAETDVSSARRAGSVDALLEWTSSASADQIVRRSHADGTLIDHLRSPARSTPPVRSRSEVRRGSLDLGLSSKKVCRVAPPKDTRRLGGKTECSERGEGDQQLRCRCRIRRPSAVLWTSSAPS